MIEDIKFYLENIAPNKESILEKLVFFIIERDHKIIYELIKELAENQFSIRDALFFTNFSAYLQGVFYYDENTLKKFSEKLAEDGASNENAKRLIKIIDDVETTKKALYISNLTRACCMDHIDISKFFKLSQCIVRLTDEDLQRLSCDIKKGNANIDCDYIDDLRYCGLLIDIVGGFAFSARAYDLHNYSLDYEHPISVPPIPERAFHSGLFLSPDKNM